MLESDYYPEGAYSDPNAPYNRVDPEDIYGDDVYERLDAQMYDMIDRFRKFACEQEYDAAILPFEEPEDIYSDEWHDWFITMPDEWQDKVKEAYCDRYFDEELEDYLLDLYSNIPD